ncbi:leucine-rich repeat domain-containing protein [Clostridium hydrogenum]|uniref:leucine-rich repeat domain-containing protein n=1 Tax=Clostridium hydrogenum TaxID=2855764 RepID=UPI001F42BDF1|nr:leucine-rich repeat domain-containing protein [Clostridium hydrogenum]
MKKYIIIIFTLFSLCFGFNAKAQIFKDGQVVAKDKAWTISFNEPVEINSNTAGSITVCDPDGNDANISLQEGQDGESIIVNPPSNGYVPGTVYYLTVDENMKAKDNKLLSNSVTMTFSIQNDSSSSAIGFKDKNLESAVRNAIGKQSGDLTKSDLEQVTTLAAVDDNITDLSGIENLTNLNSIFLGGNSISNLEPLEKLTKLQTLNLVGCQISDISPLRNLSNLQFLFLSDNSIEDISSLEGLNNLQYLSLDGNNIEDVSSLLKLPNLTDLEIANNQIKDVSPLIKLDSQLKRKDFQVDSGTVVWDVN